MKGTKHRTGARKRHAHWIFSHPERVRAVLSPFGGFGAPPRALRSNGKRQGPVRPFWVVSGGGVFLPGNVSLATVSEKIPLTSQLERDPKRGIPQPVQSDVAGDEGPAMRTGTPKVPVSRAEGDKRSRAEKLFHEKLG